MFIKVAIESHFFTHIHTLCDSEVEDLCEDVVEWSDDLKGLRTESDSGPVHIIRISHGGLYIYVTWDDNLYIHLLER